MQIGGYTVEEMKEIKRKAKEGLLAREEMIRSKLDKHSLDLINNCPPRYRKLWMDAYEGKISKTNAIKYKCLECSSYQLTEVTLCPVKNCALFTHRPFQKLNNLTTSLQSRSME